MSDVEYPGKCFGNLDEAEKSCKRCKIKQYCKHSKPFEGKTGIEVLKELTNDAGTMILKPNDVVRVSAVFLNGVLDFYEDGTLMLSLTGQDPKKLSYVTSVEEAVGIFNSLIGK